MRSTGIWQKVVWLLLLILWLPTIANAGNDMENSYHWMISPNGVNSINVQIPVYDCAGLDGFVDKGYLYITPEGGSIPNWSTFNPSIAPSGNSGIYRPEFTK